MIPEFLFEDKAENIKWSIISQFIEWQDFIDIARLNAHEINEFKF